MPLAAATPSGGASGPPTAAAALALLPAFVARRTTPIEIRDIEIP